MANGSHDDGPAAADRIREKYAKHRRAIDRAIEESGAHRDLPAHRVEMDSGEIDLEKLGVKATGIPRWALGVAIVTLAIAAAAVAVLRFWHG